MRADVSAQLFLLLSFLPGVLSHLDPLVVANCQARCLDGIGSKVNDSGGSHVQDCNLPCDLRPQSESDCVGFCQEKNKSCLDSCNFLLAFLTSSCSSLKCLNIENEKDQPAIPLNVTVKEYQFGNLVHLTWYHNFNQSGNVIFVVQMRWSLLPFINVTGWETLTKTTASTILLKEVLFPGRFYQFRIAAVSSTGTRGFSQESEPFILSTFPRPPAPPTNLREETEGSNYPILRWEPPDSDLPIENYKVTWSLRSRGVHTRQLASKEYKRLLPADKLNFTLKQVEQGALFLVQVQAVTRFKNHTLNGQKASIFVNTFSLKISDKNLPGKICNFSISNPIFNENNKTYAQVNISWILNQESVKNVMKFVIKWNEELCEDEISQIDNYQHTAITQSTFFTLPNIFLGCKYKITIQPMKRGIIGDPWTSYITLPLLPTETELKLQNSATKNSALNKLTILFIFNFLINILTVVK